MKISDKIAALNDSENPYFSFEYYPPKTEAGITKLYTIFDNMQKAKPMWVDVTWGAGGSTADSTFDICKTATSKGLEVMMHLTCTNMDINLLKEALKKCKDAGIQNILALRGDPPAGQEWKAIEGGFANAVDLVRYIRKEYGDYFCIGVAGYPEGHTDCGGNVEQDMQYLKEKVEAGADLIVTQLFYDTPCFTAFVQKCKEMGIKASIFPGIMPIQSYAGFIRMTTLCQTKVPQEIMEELEKVKDDPAAVKKYGVELASKMCKEIIESCSKEKMGDMRVRGLHFYTLNMEESVMAILDSIGSDKLTVYDKTVFPGIETGNPASA